MKASQLFVFIILFCGYTINNNYRTENHFRESAIPKNILLKIRITSIDTHSDEIYDLIRFQVNGTKNNGILLEQKSSKHSFSIGQTAKVKLCDIGQYKKIFRETDTVSFGNTPLIYGEQDNLKNDVDTLTYRGHFMLYGKIIKDGAVILDFSDDAKEPVFVICK